VICDKPVGFCRLSDKTFHSPTHTNTTNTTNSIVNESHTVMPTIEENEMTEKGWWDVPANQKAYLQTLENTLGIHHFTDWYKITRQEFSKVGGSYSRVVNVIFLFIN